MAEAVGAAATLISIIGFSAQVFDGCVKGFVLLSAARNLGRDADVLRSMLEWEQLRLEQWAEKAGLQDPAKADILLDWKLITTTLQHIKDITNDTQLLKKKYNLVLIDRAPNLAAKVPPDLDDEAEAEEDKASTSRFKRLFGQAAKSSSAAAKVLQSKNTAPKKLWWAAVDKENFQNLVKDISHFVQRLHDLLNLSIQTQIQRQVEALLEDASHRYNDVPDLEVLRELAASCRREPPGYVDSHADDIAKEIEGRFTEMLFYYIERGDAREVEQLLDKGVDMYKGQPGVGWPPLVRAAEYGKHSIVDLLLRRGADPLVGTSGNRSPLHLAAEEGHLEVVRLLVQQPSINLDQKDFVGRTPLFMAANSGNYAVVEFLLQQEGIEPNNATDDGFTPLHQSVFQKRARVIELLLERSDVDPNTPDSHGQTPLWAASGNGDEILQMLLGKKGVDVNLQGRFKETPLYHAARWAEPKGVQMLLGAGADPNICNEEERTPLGVASSLGKEEVTETLLKCDGVLIDKADKSGKSPLSQASEMGHAKCVRLLLAKGADVEIADKEGKTALALAAAKGHKVVAKVLLKSEANINAQDKEGNTPLALAAENNHDAVVRFLLESGADAELPDEDEETPFEKARDKHMDQIIRVFQEVLRMRGRSVGTQT
ncbi:hypothetical protein ACLMJK_001148 [Lecanora helva]